MGAGVVILASLGAEPDAAEQTNLADAGPECVPEVRPVRLVSLDWLLQWFHVVQYNNASTVSQRPIHE